VRAWRGLRRRALAVALLAAGVACGRGEDLATQRAALVGTWRVRWAELFRQLRASQDPDPALLARWKDRIDRAEAQGWADADVRLDPDGAAERTDHYATPRTLKGTWTLAPPAHSLAPWTVTVEWRSEPETLPATWRSQYSWNGRSLLYVMTVDASRTGDDSIPVMLSRVPDPQR
jgi:hypothetical protein